MLIALIIGIFSGVLAALKRNTFLDFIPMAVAMIGICVPTFLMGPLLVLIFGINLEILPVSGWGQLPGDKILPSLTLGFAYAAYIARLSRGGMLEVLNQDFPKHAFLAKQARLAPRQFPSAIRVDTIREKDNDTVDSEGAERPNDQTNGRNERRNK